MLRPMLATVLFAPLAIVPATAAETRNPAPEGSRHAMINFAADTMTVSESDGGTLIVLEGPHPVATAIADIAGQRSMDGFVIRHFPAYYNACTQLKDDLDLWHPDGVNSLITWRDGPASNASVSVRVEPSIVTNPNAASTEWISLEEAGTARLTLVEMVEPDVADGRLSLVVDGAPIPAGEYEGIAVMTECLIIR